MTRRSSSSNNHRRGTNSNRGGGGNSSKILILIGALCVIGLLAWGIYILIDPPSGYQFERAHLDKYVEMNEKSGLLGDGAAVYVDMSDGMNHAYGSAQSRQVLQAVINKFAANNAVEFFELSNSQITPLDMTHTALFNYMNNPANYGKQKAPIEKTLAEIVKKKQPALILSDFEEYKGGLIEKAAYAKKYFIDWLAEGYSITFYKWNFIENGKNKIMFMAVFDDNANRLSAMVDNAVRLTDPSLPRYILGGKGFDFPISTNYISLRQGGNYHNKAEQDAVSSVLEDGSVNAYYSYGKPLASSNGENTYVSLDNLVGAMAEYYPLGVKWGAVVSNAKQYQDESIDPEKENPYTHFLSKLFVDFGLQDGYAIDKVEARAFDMQSVMQTLGIAIGNGDAITLKDLEQIPTPEVNTFLTASMIPTPTKGKYEIVVDFDQKFTGAFPEGVSEEDLMRVNIVIAKATPLDNEAREFFYWDGNPSLADSVIMTLAENSSNPAGRILYTYYLRTL